MALQKAVERNGFVSALLEWDWVMKRKILVVFSQLWHAGCCMTVVRGRDN